MKERTVFVGDCEYEEGGVDDMRLGRVLQIIQKLVINKEISKSYFGQYNDVPASETSENNT